MFATVFFAGLAAAGLLACFALGLFTPLMHALQLVRTRLGRGARAPHGRTGGGVCPRPLRPDLSVPQRRFALDTRLLLTNLDHVSSRAYRSFEEPTEPRWWHFFSSVADPDATYIPAIGITGEVWRWLRQAEVLLDSDDEPVGVSLESVASAVRAVLFGERLPRDRLELLRAQVCRVDTDLRTQTGSPYRDRPRPRGPAPGAVADPLVAETGEAERRRRYDRVMASCRSAVDAIVCRYAEPSERDDLAQEIRLAVWNALPAHRGESSLRTYVLRIARYRAITFKDRRVAFCPDRPWPDPAPAPDEILGEKREWEAVARAIDRLPAKFRFALELRLEGLSYREIANNLAITEKNASVRVSRARRMVKQTLCPGLG